MHAVLSPSPRRTVLVLLTALLLPGCLKREEEISLRPDGSGTARLTVEIDTAQIEDIQAIAGAMGLGEEVTDLLYLADVANVAKALEHAAGVRVLTATPLAAASNTSHVRGGTIEVAFDNLEALARTGYFLASPGGVELKDSKDGSFTLQTRLLPSQLGSGPDDPVALQTIESVRPMLPMLEPYLEGMDLKTRYIVPGPIAATNGATQAAGQRSVEWRVGLNDLLAMESLFPAVTFKGEGLALRPFTITGTEAEAARAALLSRLVKSQPADLNALREALAEEIDQLNALQRTLAAALTQLAVAPEVAQGAVLLAQIETLSGTMRAQVEAALKAAAALQDARREQESAPADEAGAEEDGVGPRPESAPPVEEGDASGSDPSEPPRSPGSSPTPKHSERAPPG